jgi:hypothetical protein
MVDADPLNSGRTLKIRAKRGNMTHKTEEPKVSRRLRILRFGLLVVVCIAFLVAFVLPFALSQVAGGGWVQAALIPSVLYAGGTAIVCVIVYQVYKRMISR